MTNVDSESLLDVLLSIDGVIWIDLMIHVAL